MTFQAIVDRCRELAQTPVDEVAATWKAASGVPVVGCFPVYTPVELVHASGARPIGIMGAGNDIEIAHADARFQSFVCSIVKSTLELGLTERLGNVDAMLFHSICDPARNLASVFKRNFPRLRIEYLHLPQNMSSPAAEGYLVSEYRRVLAALGEITGQPATDESLRASIRLYDRTRALVRALYQVRRATPDRLSLAECYLLTRAGTVLPPEDHQSLLKEAVEGIGRRATRPRDRIRVVLEGSFCEQPPLTLLERLEEAGCSVVDDDLLVGWRWFLEDVEDEGDPVGALARAYLHRSTYSGVKHDLREPKAKHLLDRVRATRADAVVILSAKFCEPALFDYVLYRRALDEARVPHLLLEFEEKAWVFDRLTGEVETFVESMLFD